MQKSTELTFNVSTYFIPTLINEDWSHLENHEIQLVEDFWNDAVAQCPDGFEWGHFSVSDDQPDFDQCEVCERFSEVVKVTAIYWNKKA